MTRLGVGVVGLGVGEAHARTYASIPACELRWLHDLDRSRAEALGATLGDVRIAAGYDDILADTHVQLVSIASYDDAHFPQVMKALDAGKHVFVEKPLSRSLHELRAIKDAWQRAKRHLASNLILRAAPLYTWLRRAIADGELGEIYAFDGDYLYGRLHKITDGWRRDVPDYSVMEGGGVHLVDLMLWLTGEQPTRVCAMGNRIATAGTAFRQPDYVAATFAFASGLVGRITANFGCMHRHQHVVRVFGTAATFIADDRGARLHASRDPDKLAREITLSATASSKGDLIPDFVNAIVNGGNTATLTQLDLDVLCACAAADRALAANTAIDVTYV
jgi:predicted dehydrogenase